MFRTPLPLVASLALTGTAFAQTSTTHATPHRTTAGTTHRASAARPSPATCAKLPELSPKIPALPTGTPCAKPLVTISEGIEFSPLVGPDLRKNFGDLPMSFSLAYVDLNAGAAELAKPHMYYTVRYTGYLADGTKFDSSYDHPETADGITFPYGGHRVIPGWDMGFEGMHVGGKRRLFIPYQLGYGDRPHGPIPAKAELVFDMELVRQSDQPPTPPTPATPPATPGASTGQSTPASPGATPPTPPSTTPAPSGAPQSPTAPTAPTTPAAPTSPTTPTTPH